MLSCQLALQNLLFWNSGSIWVGCPTPKTMVHPHYSYTITTSIKNISRIYFALLMFWRQCHHSWPSILKLPKLSENFVQCFTQTEVPLSSPHPHSTSPQYLGLFGVFGIAHTAHMVCKQGDHWANPNNAVSPHAPAWAGAAGQAAPSPALGN